MSIWYEINDIKDIDLSEDGREIEVNFDSNEWGNVYVTVPVELIESLLRQREINNHLAEDSNG